MMDPMKRQEAPEGRNVHLFEQHLRQNERLPPPTMRRRRAPHENPHVYAPFVYAVVLPSIRLGLRGRVPQPVIDRVFLGGVGLALCHAGFMMFGDSTV